MLSSNLIEVFEPIYQNSVMIHSNPLDLQPKNNCIHNVYEQCQDTMKINIYTKYLYMKSYKLKTRFQNDMLKCTYVFQ